MNWFKRAIKWLKETKMNKDKTWVLFSIKDWELFKTCLKYATNRYPNVKATPQNVGRVFMEATYLFHEFHKVYAHMGKHRFKKAA